MPKGTTARHIELARLFLYGPPHLKGDFRACAKEAGFTGRPPSRDSKTMQTAFEAAEVDQARFQEAGAEEPETRDTDLDQLNRLLESEEDPDWTELGRLAKRALAKVGTGVIQASTGQVSSLKEIINRAEGRVGQERGDDEDKTYVVVLPAKTPYSEDAIIDLDQEDLRKIEEGEILE